MLADLCVHHRLRGSRFVGLVVAESAIADQIDDHVLVELHAVGQRLPRDEHHGLRIVRIDVEDRRFEHLRHVAAIHGRTRVARIVGGEAHLVVDDQVHGAAGVERARLRQLQGFHHHALAGECRVTVDQDGQHPLAGGIAATLLARTHRTLDHRIHDFEMRRIERQRHVHVAARRAQIGREALVILDVAGPLQVRGVVAAFEFGEQFRRRLAQHVDQHVQAAAMRHADDDFLEAGLAAPLHQVVQHRDQRIAAFEREALLAHVLRVQVALEAFRRSDLLEDVEALFGAELVQHAALQELVLQPQPLVGIGDMRELGTDGSGIHAVEQRDDVAQLGAARHGIDAAGGEELLVEVRFGQPHVVQVHQPRLGALHETQRIDLGDQVTAVGEDLDQARDSGLFFALARVALRQPLQRAADCARCSSSRTMGPCAVSVRAADRPAKYFCQSAGTFLAGKISFVEVFYVGRVAAPERGGGILWRQAAAWAAQAVILAHGYSRELT